MAWFLILLSLFSQTAFCAAVPSGVPQISIDQIGTMGGKSAIPPSSLSGTGVNGIFSLTAGDGSNNLTAGNFYPFYKNGVAYQVTSGKTAYCFNITLHTSAVANAAQLVSATASFAFNAGSITGGVHQAGAAGKYPMVNQAASTNNGAPQPGTYQFGATTFPGIQSSASATCVVRMDCYEL